MCKIPKMQEMIYKIAKTIAKKRIMFYNIEELCVMPVKNEF